jgi:hypothetical protein
MPEFQPSFIQEDSKLSDETIHTISANLSYYSDCISEINTKTDKLNKLNSSLAAAVNRVKAIDDEMSDDTLKILKLNLETQIKKFVESKQSALQAEQIQNSITRLRDDLLLKTDIAYAECKSIFQELVPVVSTSTAENLPAAAPLTNGEIIVENPLVAMQQHYKEKLIQLLEKHKPKVQLEDKRIKLTRNYLVKAIFYVVKSQLKPSQWPRVTTDLQEVLSEISTSKSPQKIRKKLEPYKTADYTLAEIIKFLEVIFPKHDYKTFESFFLEIEKYYRTHPVIKTIVSLMTSDNRIIMKYLPTLSHLKNLLAPSTDKGDVEPILPIFAELFPEIKDSSFQEELIKDFKEYRDKLHEGQPKKTSELDLLLLPLAGRRRIKSDIEINIDDFCAHPIGVAVERKAWVVENNNFLGITNGTWEAVLEFISMLFGRHQKIEVTNTKIAEVQKATTVLEFFKRLHSYLQDSSEIAVEPVNNQAKSSFSKVFSMLNLNPLSAKSSKSTEEIAVDNESPLIKEHIAKISSKLPMSAELNRLVSDPTGEEIEKFKRNKEVVSSLGTQINDLQTEIDAIRKTNVADVNAPLIKLLRIHALHALKQTLNPAQAYSDPKIPNTYFNSIMHWFYHSPGWFTNSGGQQPIFKFIRDLFDPKLENFSAAADLVEKFLQRHKTKESGLHSDSFDTFFLQLLYNTGTPKGLFRLTLTKDEIDNINDLPSPPLSIPNTDAELKRLMQCPLDQKVELAGVHKYYLRGINCQSSHNRGIIRTKAIGNFAAIKALVGGSSLALLNHYSIEPIHTQQSGSNNIFSGALRVP